ncbi:hypothetical protein P7K49_035439 [Saguinus oedipus]|uniref:Uncharacterized protein n=1 Tax=Saguinus oedipus TaxID=9490 RepID=A0ABQ9TMM8_SAGOE|nr:hypothetical protein P7K49_035439 [Saguinus oedipus]
MRSVANDELHVMMQRRMSQENPSQATETELAQRLQRLTILAVNRIIYQEFNSDIIDILRTPENVTQSKTSVFQTEIPEEYIHHEQPSVFNPFQKEIFAYLVEGFKVSISCVESSIGSSKTSGSKQQWTKILWSCKETFRMQLGRLLVHILSPAHAAQERKQIFEIVHEPNHQEILRDCLSPSLQEPGSYITHGKHPSGSRGNRNMCSIGSGASEVGPTHDSLMGELQPFPQSGNGIGLNPDCSHFQ